MLVATPMATPISNSLNTIIGHWLILICGILAESIGYSSAVKVITSMAFTRAGIAALPKNGAKSIMPVSRTPMVNNAPKI